MYIIELSGLFRKTTFTDIEVLQNQRRYDSKIQNSSWSV